MEEKQGKLKDRDALLEFIATELPEKPAVAEVGVLRGAFSQKIKSALLPSELVLVDTFGKHYSTFKDYKDYDAAKWERIYEKVRNMFAGDDSVQVIRSFSVDASKMFPDGHFDFIYIDADHERLDEDLSAWLPKLKKGGYIAGHDFNLKKVKNDVVARFGEDYNVTGEPTIPSWYKKNI